MFTNFVRQFEKFLVVPLLVKSKSWIQKNVLNSIENKKVLKSDGDK